MTQAVEVLLKKPEDGSSGMIEAEQQSPNVIEEDEASADECYVLHLDNWRKDGQHPYIEHSLKGSREGSCKHEDHWPSQLLMHALAVWD